MTLEFFRCRCTKRRADTAHGTSSENANVSSLESDASSLTRSGLKSVEVLAVLVPVASGGVDSSVGRAAPSLEGQAARQTPMPRRPSRRRTMVEVYHPHRHIRAAKKLEETSLTMGGLGTKPQLVNTPLSIRRKPCGQDGPSYRGGFAEVLA
jgi:hypothetical protein